MDKKQLQPVSQEISWEERCFLRLTNGSRKLIMYARKRGFVMNKRILWITETAVLLALLIV
jgi:hypothetical protein